MAQSEIGTVWQRVLAYSTGSVVTGLLLIILTNSFIKYVAMEGTTGYLVLMGFGFVFLNLGFGLSRRYSMKTRRAEPINYLFSTLVALPSVAWVLTKDEGLAASRYLFLATVLFALYLGTYYGIRRGLAKRREYLEQARREGDLPDGRERARGEPTGN